MTSEDNEWVLVSYQPDDIKEIIENENPDLFEKMKNATDEEWDDLCYAFIHRMEHAMEFSNPLSDLESEVAGDLEYVL